MSSFTDYFPLNSEVEVSSDDEGFRGSWYAATITIPPFTTKTKKSKSNPNGTLTQVEIQYKTLYQDEEGTILLKETLSVYQIRPKPPNDNEKETEFKFSDEVDAYYNDGWWEGVVTEVVKVEGKEKFKLYFRGTKEEILFEKDKLRVHREWENGCWKPAPVLENGKEDENTSSKSAVKPGKAVAKEKFSKGTLIEVNSDEEGFQGAWFAATVVKSLGKNKFLIEYQNLRTEDDSEFLREEIDNLHIRPCPPEIVKVDGYSVLEEVDAFYNDAWWVGVISKVLSGSKYTVYFRYSNEEMEFSHTDLRPHQDWIDGKWVVSSQALKL